jgi:hypothetical protein
MEAWTTDRHRLRHLRLGLHHHLRAVPTAGLQCPMTHIIFRLAAGFFSHHQQQQNHEQQALQS